MSALRASSEEPADLPAMTLFEHLAELRSRIIKCVIAVVAGASVVWWLYNPAFRWLTNVLQSTCAPGQECQLVFSDPIQNLSTRFSFSGYGGVVLAMPVLLWQLWRFIMPGLYARERRLALPFVLSALLLFCLGAGLSLWTLPRALDFLIGVGGESFAQFYSPDRYMMFVVKMMLAFGIGFEFPIVLIFAQLAGIVEPSTLARGRRYAIVAIVVIVAVLTPSGDPVSLAALAIPMIGFYEGAILFGRLHRRRRRRRQATA